MSVTRVGEFQARAGQAEALRAQIHAFVPLIQASPGCQSCLALQSQDDPARFVIIEVWDSVEAHQASVQRIPQRLLNDTIRLLAGPPRGGYYGTVD